MDSIDSSRSNLPASFSAPLSLQPVSRAAFSGELAQASMPQINTKVLLRGLTRHWWRILLLWLVVSVPLVCLLFYSIEPTYEAYSTVRIEPTKPELFSPVQNSFVESRAVRPFLETQVQVIVSNHVLEQAVANPQVVNLPFVKQSDDPKADLRKRMSVEILDNAYIIRVALELSDAKQAATIVNSVVEAFLVQNTIFNRTLNKNLQTNLEGELAKLETLQRTKTAEWRSWSKKARSRSQSPHSNPTFPTKRGINPPSVK